MSAIEEHNKAKAAWDAAFAEAINSTSMDKEKLHACEDEFHQKTLALIAHLCDDPSANVYMIKFIAQNALATLSFKFDRWAA